MLEGSIKLVAAPIYLPRIRVRASRCALYLLYSHYARYASALAPLQKQQRASQRTAYGSIRQHTAAYVSIRQHTTQQRASERAQKETRD